MSADTAKRTIEVIAEFKKMPADQITTETTMKDLELDSLDGLNLVFELEEEFDVVIPDDKALSLKTVGEMVEGIETLLADAEPKPDESGESNAKPASAEGS